MSEAKLMLTLDVIAKMVAEIYLARNSYRLLTTDEKIVVNLLAENGYMEAAHSLANTANPFSVASVVSASLTASTQGWVRPAKKTEGGQSITSALEKAGFVVIQDGSPAAVYAASVKDVQPPGNIRRPVY